MKQTYATNVLVVIQPKQCSLPVFINMVSEKENFKNATFLRISVKFEFLGICLYFGRMTNLPSSNENAQQLDWTWVFSVIFDVKNLGQKYPNSVQFPSVWTTAVHFKHPAELSPHLNNGLRKIMVSPMCFLYIEIQILGRIVHIWSDNSSSPRQMTANSYTIFPDAFPWIKVSYFD